MIESDKDAIRARHERAHARYLLSRGAEEQWGWGTHAGRIRARRRASLIAAGAGLKPGTRALEIGCGTGVFTELFSQSGAHIDALDISPELIERARQRNLTGQVVFHEVALEGFSSEDLFDAIIGSSVLHHLDLADALERIRRFLKPGAVMCFAEPNMRNPQVFLERTLRFLPCFAYVSPDETAYTARQVRRDLLNAGFEQIEIHPFDWLHPATPQSLIPAVSRIGDAVERMPLISLFAGSLLIRARLPLAG